MTTSIAARQAPRMIRSRSLLLLGLGLGAGLLISAILSSVALGAADIRAATVWEALFRFNGSTEHVIIRTLRVPRALAATLVGAALAVAGALMQGVTRNPLADPGILGIEAGAALGVVCAVFFFRVTSLTSYALWAFAGAALTAVTVYALGSAGRGGVTPMKLTLAGAAITAALSSLMTGVLLLNQRTLDEVRFWLAGSVAGRDLDLLMQAMPYLACGLLLALMLGRQVTTLSCGEDIARGLGQHMGLVKAQVALAIVLLAGSSVAIAGPIGFVGLVIPHVVRFIVGGDYRWILPYAALTGAIFLIGADLVARFVVRPAELPVGVMTALIGGPFFVTLIRWRLAR